MYFSCQNFMTFRSWVVSWIARHSEGVFVAYTCLLLVGIWSAFRPFLTDSFEPILHSLQWTLIPFSKHVDPSNLFVTKSDIIGSNFVVVNTGIFDTNSELHYATEGDGQSKVFRFNFVPPYKQRKSRLELTTCYTMEEDIVSKYGKIPVGLESILKISCPAAQLPLDHIHTYEYEIYISSENFNPKGDYIFTQWHGSPDPTFVQDEFGCVMQTTFKDLHKMCSKGKCRDGKILNKNNEFTGIKYNQGGYPPLSMWVREGYILIGARSDEKLFVRKKSCRFRGSERSICSDHPRQQNDFIYKVPVKDFLFDRWVKFIWKIKWSEYSVGWNNYKNPGHRDSDAWIQVWMNGEKIVDWVGPCGRNDNGRTPYFKTGLYNPTGSRIPITLYFRHYNHTHESLDCHKDEEVRQMAPRLKTHSSATATTETAEQIATNESRCESTKKLSSGVWVHPVRVL